MRLVIVGGHRVRVVNVDDLKSLPDVARKLSQDEILAIYAHERRRNFAIRLVIGINIIRINQSPAGTFRLHGLPIDPRLRMQASHIQKDADLVGFELFLRSQTLYPTELRARRR